ncbi:MAG: FAD-dependent oxidoreductase [Alphaproteobacteria bacterium]|nr:FAD-dependent oxidoreductase [Alphaproteobacteria bacterium]
MAVAAQGWDEDADVVVVGSGAAGLTAALTAAAGGARVVILEKSAMLGGTTAMSGAGIWIPANHHMLAAGMSDSKDEALTYIRAVAPEGWQAVEDALWRAFVDHAPETLEFIERHTPLAFELVHHPDLYSEAPGGKYNGRMVSTLPISRNLLGRWRDRIRPSTVPHLFTYDELRLGTLMERPVWSIFKLGPRLIWRFLTRRVAMGNGLVTGLLKGCLDRGCHIVAEARARRLIESEDRIAGIEVELADGTRRIRARRGVVLATGGFEWNAALRERYFPGETCLIGAPDTNTGDGHAMAEAVGARLERMDQANIYPSTIATYEGRRHAQPLYDMTQPHSILVNRDARRFVSEGEPNVGVALDARDPASGQPIHMPAWRIFDARFAANNSLAMRIARSEKGWLRKADDLATLARMTGLDAGQLGATVARFNCFVRQGKDDDFRRGETAWERFYSGDMEGSGVNSALGTIEEPPFYAMPFPRALLVTKGGPRTNERGQVLRADGSRIAGLYCAGVAMANPIGSKAVGAGTTLGPCLTWGRICGLNLLRENV